MYSYRTVSDFYTSLNTWPSKCAKSSSNGVMIYLLNADVPPVIVPSPRPGKELSSEFRFLFSCAQVLPAYRSTKPTVVTV